MTAVCWRVALVLSLPTVEPPDFAVDRQDHIRLLLSERLSYLGVVAEQNNVLWMEIFPASLVPSVDVDVH
jgi:hypothetical protein